MVESLGSEVSPVCVSNLCGLILKALFLDLLVSKRRALTVTTVAGYSSRAGCSDFAVLGVCVLDYCCGGLFWALGDFEDIGFCHIV